MHFLNENYCILIKYEIINNYFSSCMKIICISIKISLKILRSSGQKVIHGLTNSLIPEVLNQWWPSSVANVCVSELRGYFCHSSCCQLRTTWPLIPNNAWLGSDPIWIPPTHNTEVLWAHYWNLVKNIHAFITNQATNLHMCDMCKIVTLFDCYFDINMIKMDLNF